MAVESRGLEDDDIDQACPNFPPSPAPLANVCINLKLPSGLQCDTSHKNKVRLPSLE